MNGFGEGVLQIADNIVSAVGNLGVGLGLFPDGRDHVDLLPGKGFQTVSFPDHADEGWPAFELRVPESFRFRGAWFSFLCRRAHLHSETSTEKLLDDVQTLAGISFESVPGKGWSTTLANGVEVALARVEGGSILAIRQTRTAEELERAMKARPRRAHDARWAEELCGRFWCDPWGGSEGTSPADESGTPDPQAAPEPEGDTGEEPGASPA